MEKNGLKGKLQKDGKDLIVQSLELKNLFQKADRKAVERALKNEDWGATCKALGVSESWLVGFLKAGKENADRLGKAHPEFVEAAKRKAATK